MAGWESISDICRVAGELSLLVERLTQALEQLARHTRSAPTAGVDRCTGGVGIDDPEMVVAAAVALDAAQRSADLLGRQLAEAHNSLSHITSPWPTE